MAALAGEPWRGLARIQLTEALGSTDYWCALSDLSNAPAPSGDQSVWQGNPGDAFTLTVEWRRTGTTTASVANKMQVEAHLPGGAILGALVEIATGGVDGQGSITIHLDDLPMDASLGSLRSGTIEILLRAIKDNGTGGVGNFTVDSRGGGTAPTLTTLNNARGYMRSNLILSSHSISNASLGGAEPAKFAYPDAIYVRDVISAQLYEATDIQLDLRQAGASKRLSAANAITGVTRDRTFSTAAAQLNADFAAADTAVDARLSILSPGNFGGDNNHVFGVPLYALDAASTPHNGRLIGTVLPSRVVSPFSGFGNALSFDGVNRGDLTSSVDCGPPPTGVAQVSGFGAAAAFCLEVKFVLASTVNQYVCGREDGHGQQPTIYVKSGALRASMVDISGPNWFQLGSAAAVAGDLYSACLDYDGTTLRFWVSTNGGLAVLRGSSAVGSVRAASVATTRFMMGRADSATFDMEGVGSASNPFSGTMDEVHWSKTSRHTSAYTPSASPATADANTLGLWHLDDPSLHAAGWSLTSETQLDATSDATANSAVTSSAVTRTTSTDVVNFGFHSVGATFKLANSRGEFLGATGTPAGASGSAAANVFSRDIVASADQKQMSTNINPNSSGLYTVASQTYTGPTSTANRGTGTTGDTAAHTIAGKDKGIHPVLTQTAAPPVAASARLWALSDLFRLDVHPQVTSTLVKDTDPYATPGSAETLAYIIAVHTLYAFAFIGDVNGVTTSAGVQAYISLYDPLGNLIGGPTAKTCQASGVNDGWITNFASFSTAAPEGNWILRVDVELDNTSARGNYGSGVTISPAPANVSALDQAVGFISPYSADKDFCIDLPDEVPVGETVRIIAEYLKSDGTHVDIMGLDGVGSPTIKIFHHDPTDGTHVIDQATSAMTQFPPATDVWYFDWTPSASGTRTVQFTGSANQANVVRCVHLSVRPRFDPIALALTGDLVSRM